MLVAGLFAGVGGFELGFERADHRPILLCESNEHAAHVLRRRWSEVRLHGDVAMLEGLPDGAEIVTAGFPCQNLSMAGDKKGIAGGKSTIVGKLFDLLDRDPVRWVVIENVYFMLHLWHGSAIEYILGRLEQRGYRWAYRVVNSRAFGLPQRRRRVFIVGSQSADPRDVLLADDAGSRKWPSVDMAHPMGFYWTEGRTGHGLTADAIPPLKAGSTLGIPSPPAVLLRSGRVATPTIEAVERFQGFPRGWTAVLRERSARHRWRLLGNAVSVPVAEWIGHRLAEPGCYDGLGDAPLSQGGIVAWRGLEHGLSQGYAPSCRRCDGASGATAAGTEFCVRNRTLAGFIETGAPGIHHESSDGTSEVPPGFLDVLESNLR